MGRPAQGADRGVADGGEAVIAMRTALGLLLCVGALAEARALAAAPNRLDLIGQVTGAGRGPVRVTLFAIDEPYTAATETDLLGEFRFRGLAPGNYTVSVLKGGLGATRRTVVVTPGLADDKGTIRMTLAYQAAEAAGVSGGTISKNSLSVPDRARNKYTESQKQLAKRDVEAARRSLKAAVDLAPQFTQAWNALGMIAYQTHEFAAAERYFRAALAAEPAAFEPAANLAGVLLSEGEFEESLNVNQRALAERPSDALANVQAGIAYFALGDFDHSEAALTQTLRVDPSHFSKPQLFLADIYMHRGDGAAAVETLKDYVARHPDAADADRQRQRIRQLERVLAEQRSAP
jgi:Tfp pilus assembly protein PilF